MSYRTRDEAARRAWAEIGALFDANRDRFLGTMSSHGLRPPHAIALRALAEPQPMSRIAELLRCDRSTMTWLADRLEERGLVERVSDPADRRVTLLELTTEGRRVRDLIAEAQAEPPAGFSGLTRAEMQTLGELVAKLRGASPGGPGD